MNAVQYCRQMRWHKKHLRTITAKLTTDEYEMFRTVCRMNHTTPYRLLSRFARAYMVECVKDMTQRGAAPSPEIGQLDCP